MAKRSRARLEDLQWLADQLDAMSKYQSASDTAQRDRIARLNDWMSVVIDTRVAQITQPQTEHNRELVGQYHAAVAQWESEREDQASDYTTDMRLWEADHPRPDWTRFLVDQRRRVEAVKACACPMIIDHRPGCPLKPVTPAAPGYPPAINHDPRCDGARNYEAPCWCGAR